MRIKEQETHLILHEHDDDDDDDDSQNPLERGHIQHDEIQLRTFLFTFSSPHSLPISINLVPLPSYL